jgi:crotonobetainyl-CoA:carnitine CoA-transferase CaiB-like acyl-CoA transferase
MKPLKGIRILTIEYLGATPYWSMFLAALGADILKIDSVETDGDSSPSVGLHTLGDADSQYFQKFSLNKRPSVFASLVSYHQRHGNGGAG